jgi:Zn-dependent protease with chaperone function
VRKVGWSLVVLGLLTAAGSYYVAMNDLAHVVHRDAVVAAMAGLSAAIVGLIIVQLRS